MHLRRRSAFNGYVFDPLWPSFAEAWQTALYKKAKNATMLFTFTLPLLLLPFLPDLTSGNVFILRFRFEPGENHVRPRLISKPERPFFNADWTFVIVPAGASA